MEFWHYYVTENCHFSFLLLLFSNFGGSFQPEFRIAATGVVLDLDKSIKIVKKLKLTGFPFKIFKNTSFIKVCISIYSYVINYILLRKCLELTIFPVWIFISGFEIFLCLQRAIFGKET